MHEQSLMNDLMKKILTIASQEGAARVTKVTVQLGALSHMSGEHFREHFDESAKGTIAEAAELATVESTDINEPNAQDILLLSVDVACEA